ncbi:MAG: DNA repair protein [Rhodocyclales bacterium]|jgi:DNA repair protein RadC|nr:MAG: DNA repair protein [Rhodocyclales bacterium]
MAAAVSPVRVRRGDAVIREALEILERRLRRPGGSLASPRAVRDYLRLRLGEMERECFVVMLLDAQNRLLECAVLFYGTLTQTSVHPREVVKLALAHNAAGAIFAHNHPSGVAEQSRADEMLTQTLKSALALVDVKALDHFIVAGVAEPLSFAERGLL